MDVSVLREIGLTENDIKTYLSVVDLGRASATHIARNAHIHRSKAYESLDRLLSQGLVRFTEESFGKVFEANAPETLLQVLTGRRAHLNEVEDRIKKMLPELRARLERPNDPLGSRVYEGIAGIKAFHDDVLAEATADDRIDILGIPPTISERMEGFLLEFHEQRLRKGTAVRLLYENAAQTTAVKRKDMSLVEARVLPEHITSPSIVFIFRDRIGLIVFSPRPQCFEIRSSDIAASFRSFFDAMWTISR